MLAVVLIGLVSGGTTFGSGYTEARGLLDSRGHLSIAHPFLKMASMVGYLAAAAQAPRAANDASLAADAQASMREAVEATAENDKPGHTAADEISNR